MFTKRPNEKTSREPPEVKKRKFIEVKTPTDNIDEFEEKEENEEENAYHQLIK